MPEHDLLVNIRLRNNILYELIFSKFASVSAFCEDAGLRPTEVGLMLNLKVYPLVKIGPHGRTSKDYHKICLRISEYFKQLPEDIFPLELYELEDTEVSLELGIEHVSLLECAGLSVPAGLEERVDTLLLHEHINRALERLIPRHRRVIEMYYGLGEYAGCEHTCEEIGTIMGVTRSRVDQIVKKALRYLRRPLIHRNLKKFVE